MSRRRSLNIAAFVLAFVGSAAAAVRTMDSDDRGPLEIESKPGEVLRFTTLPDGTRALLDAGEHPVPLRNYSRIMSSSSVADALLADLSESARVLSYTRYAHDFGIQRHMLEGVATTPVLSRLEAVLSMKPDLLLLNNLGDPAGVQRLRGHGFEVFDLGQMRGMETLLPNIHAIATLLGRPEQGRKYALQLQQRMQRIAMHIPKAQRRTALYVSPMNRQLYGGTVGSSYHDVLRAAGLIDAAEGRFREWPVYSAVQLLDMDPEHIITREAGRESLCRHPGLERLQACRQPWRIVTVPESLLSHPGPRMLEAAERVHDAVYGKRSRD